MKRIERDALRVAREEGFVAEIEHGRHPKLILRRGNKTYRLPISGTPTNADITLRNIQRDLRRYCNE